MLLIEKIKSNQISARKARDAFTTTVLTTLLGEAEKIGKDAGNRKTTDEEVVAVVKKFMKNYDEFLKVADEETKRKIEAEKKILSEYLPAQMSEQQIAEIISALNLKDLGSIMKHFNSNFKGQFDGKLVSTVAKNMVL